MIGSAACRFRTQGWDQIRTDFVRRHGQVGLKGRVTPDRREPPFFPRRRDTLIGPSPHFQKNQAIADTSAMSMVDDIASFSTAMSMARVQTAVAAKLLKMANQQQGQVVSSLLESAMENAQAIAAQVAQDIGNNVDTLA